MPPQSPKENDDFGKNPEQKCNEWNSDALCMLGAFLLNANP